MFLALILLILDALLVAVAFAYIWLALVPAWIGRVVEDDAEAGDIAATSRRVSTAIETLRQRRQPAHRRHAVVFSNARGGE